VQLPAHVPWSRSAAQAFEGVAHVVESNAPRVDLVSEHADPKGLKCDLDFALGLPRENEIPENRVADSGRTPRKLISLEITGDFVRC
jgi:hypothetical protein